MAVPCRAAQTVTSPMARAWKETLMNHIQRRLNAPTALAGALLAVFITRRPVGGRGSPHAQRAHAIW